MTYEEVASRTTEQERARRPMPLNARVLFDRCLRESEKHVGLGDVPGPEYLRSARRGWAIMALASAISCKHASSAIRRHWNTAARMRVRYARFSESADAFGSTLVAVWVDEMEAA